MNRVRLQKNGDEGSVQMRDWGTLEVGDCWDMGWGVGEGGRVAVHAVDEVIMKG